MTYNHRRLSPLLNQYWWFAVLFFVLAAQTAWASGKSNHFSISDLEAMVAEQLIQDGAGDIIKASLMGKYRTILHQSERPIHVELAEFDYNARNLRWNAAIMVYEGDTLAANLDMNGRFENLVEVPVLVQRLHDDDVIEDDDIEWVAYPEHRLRKDTVMAASELIGYSPKRVISESRPIRESELIRPRVIEKGDLVQLQFRTNHMEIRTIGQAMSEGAIGDNIAVKNNESEIVVQATITGPNAAEVKHTIQLN